ncbi:MAG: hypothetical protein FOGNACKC_00267 [Anaerolineae bacterium]|nr:hypothetical protein [Anaerolineae bacterium]
MTISIRTPQTIAEFDWVEQLQAEIWGSREDAVPSHLLLTLAKESGIVHVMLDGETPIGFSFGFLSRTESGLLKLASHQAGVRAAYRGQGLGYQLKLAQREAALALGLKLITWTFDPLQSANARLNLHKLGAVCRTYYRNLYGDMADLLNEGLPSDRFRVDWWLESGHVAARLAGEDSPAEPALPAVPRFSPPANPAAFLESLAGPACLVEIPANLPQLKTDDPALARRWRLDTRQIFETLFARGYTAIDLLHHGGQTFILLQHSWQPL